MSGKAASSTQSIRRVVPTVGTEPKRTWDEIYMASCAQNNDPLNQGRIKMYVPQVLGKAISDWATPLGFSPITIPAVGQMVHAYFAGGDINRPVYIYTAVLSDISNVAGLVTAVDAIKGYPGAWSNITLNSDWQNAGGNFTGAQVRAVFPGVGQITGLIAWVGTTGGVASQQAIGTLPSQFVYSSSQDIPGIITGVSTLDIYSTYVTGQTDVNGLTDGSIGNNSGIVNTGLGFSAGSNDHAHFPGTYRVNDGTHYHTNFLQEQLIDIPHSSVNPNIVIDNTGALTLWGASAFTSQLSLNGTIVI